MRNFEFGSKQISIIVITTAVYSLFGLFGSAFQIAPGVSLVYPATAIAVVFSMWFGVWAVVGVYLGTIIGGLTWAPILVNSTGGFTTILEGLIPALVFYGSTKLKKDLSDRKSLTAYIVFAVVLGTFACAVLGNLNYTLWGYQTLEYALTVGIWVWWLGDAVAALVIGIPLLRLMTPYVMKTSLYHQGFIQRRV